MAIKKQSDYRSVEGTSNSSKKVPTTKEASAESSGLRRSGRENAWGKQPSSFSKTLIKKLDDETSSSPSSTRKSERLEKIFPTTTPLKKKPGTSEENPTPETAPVKNKFQTAEGQQMSSPLRRSARNKKETLLNPSPLRNKINPSTLEKPVTSESLLDISVEKSGEISPKDLSPEANQMSQIKDHTSESVGTKRKRMDARSYKALFKLQRDRIVIPPGSTGADSRAGDTVTPSVQELCVPKSTQREISNNAEDLKGREETETQGEASTSHGDTQITKVSSNVLNDGQPNICLSNNIDGKLLCCSGKDCNRSYHPLCLDPLLNEISPGDWLCPSCMKKKVELGVHSVNQRVESIWDVRDIEVPGAGGLQKQYFVKYKGLAHVHNHWVPETQLLTEAPALVSEFSKMSKVGAWNKEWTTPHCLLQKRLIYSKQQEDHQIHHATDSLCQHEWLVKWIDLGNEHSTWELDSAPFLRTPDALHLIEEYENRHCMKEKDSSVQPEKDNISEHRKLPSLLTSSNADKYGLETVLEVNHGKSEESLSHSVLHDFKSVSSRYVEYWVPVSISTVQLEQYCSVLLANSITLRSCSKNDLVDAMRDVLVSTRKCCDHPYAVDPSLQGLLVKGRSPPEYLDVGIKASGKLQLLDTVLSEIKNKGLRVLILFQYISGSGRDTTGDILDDFLRQRFGQDSYERVDGGLPQHRKQAAVNKFNDKSSNRFVFLLEIRACQSSIKLSAVDGIIVFDSDWNPSLDLKALNRMFIDSSLKQIKIFRLYSPFTLEEKVLIIAAQNVTLDNSLHNINRSTSHQLLKWGASYLFKKLDLFHDADTDCSDISLEASILKDVAHEFLGLLCSHDEVHMENSLIVKVKHCEGTYSKNNRLLGERELQNVLDESHLFWANLLDGRSPTWKYPSGLLQRSRKRVNYDESNEISKDELDAGKKRKKTSNVVAISPSPELGRNETEPIEKADSGGLQPAESSKGEASAMQHKFHFLLKSNMEKVYEVLQLPDVVKLMAGELLDYIIDNHHISREPENIFQAFQISLCWNAASLVKNKIYKDKSLAMVKKHLNFSCTEEEANHVYSKMRNLRKMFLEHTNSLKEPKYSKDVVSLTDDDGPIGLPLAEKETCHLQVLNVQNAETEKLNRRTKQVYAELLQNFLRQYPIEKRVERHFEKIKNNYGTHLARLLVQQQEEILNLKKQMVQKREEINAEYRLRIAVICNIHGKISARSDKLKKIEEEDLSRRMEELQQQKEMCLKELEEKHVCERNVEMKKATDKFEKLKSFSPFPGDSDLHSLEPVIVGSESASCAKEQTDQTWSTSDEPQLVSSEPTTCVDDQSNIQLVNEAVGFTMKPRGSSDIDIFPGVFNRELEQQRPCSSDDTTVILERPNLPLQQTPDKGLSSSAMAPSKSSSTVMEVSDSIIATELIAEHCETEETNLVVIDEMPNQNNEISRSANSDKVCCKEPGSADREHLQQESLVCSKSSCTVMEDNNSIIDTEIIAEHGQTDEASLVVIDEMRNQNDDVSRSAGSDNICCEEPGSVDRERLHQESLFCSQGIVDSLAISGPNDPTCDELHQVEFPSVPKDLGSVDETCGGESGTLGMEILQQESLADSAVVANSCNMSGRNDQNSGEDIGNADLGSSQQVSIAGSQVGVDCCNNEANLHRVSDVVETTITTDNANLPPVSVIEGSNEASGFSIQPNMDICSSSQFMTTSVQVEGSAVRQQGPTQIPISRQPVNMQGPPTVQNQLSMHEPSSAEVLHQQYEGIREEAPEQLIVARGLSCLPSVNAFPSGQGTQLTAQSRTSDRPNLFSYGDPLQIEHERLSKKIEQVKKSLNDERAVLELARAKELEEVNQKYNAKIHEAETTCASNTKELDMRRHKVLMNKHLADAFRIKCDALQYGLSSTSNMQQFRRPTTDGTGSAPSLTNCLSSTSNMQQFLRSLGRLTTDGTGSAPHLLPHNVLHPRIPNMPTRAPPQVVSLPNCMINHQVGGEIRAPAPHLRFRPSYHHSPYNRPVRADVNGLPSRCQNSLLTPVGSIASTDNRLGLQTPAGFPSAHPITPSGFAAGRPNSPADFAFARPNSPACFPSGHAVSPPGFVSSHPPATSSGFSSAHPIEPMSRTKFGVAVQALNTDPPVVAHEVVYLSDDDDDDENN